MGIWDLFKSQWSASDMTPDDRKKLFWYLKRKTSYTAWERQANAFDKFSAIFKTQVIEEPSTGNDLSGTDWEAFYPQILKAQVLYEQALTLLKSGDRSVWLYNERGILRDAGFIAHHWHEVLVNHGLYGDVFLDGKYVNEMANAIQEFYDASNDVGYLQPAMNGGAAPECWTTRWQAKFAKLSIPPRLPEVPVPTLQTLVRTNEPIPVFGIYEPQIKDGCMNYLLAGAPAPSMELTNGKDYTGQQTSVAWRLIWEDTRYLDGIIHDDEALYFPFTEKVTAFLSHLSEQNVNT